MKTLTGGQKFVLVAATIPMVGAGALGAWGTYANIASVFHRSATALGVVAAGEGATLVLALVLVGLTMLGQPSPAAVRAGLWLLPAAASVTGVIVAPGARDAVVFAVTPMAMTVSAEGLGLLARRIVVHRTGVDVEAQRRNARRDGRRNARNARRTARDTARLRDLNWHSARADHHDSDRARKRSRDAVWRLARRIATHDAELGAALAEVQRTRIIEGADATLAALFGNTPRNTAALPPATPRHPATPEAKQPPSQDCDARHSVPENAEESASLSQPAASAQQPSRAVHQRMTPGLEAAIEDALRPVADDHDSIRLLTVAEVAKQKGVTPGTVRSWVNRGKLTPAQRDADGRLRFHPAAVAELD